MRDLSILIPARHETWLGDTIRDVLAHARANTEILIGLDGAWPEHPLDQHPDVTMVYRPWVRGQRGMTNDLAALSSARYVMKLDAHCAVAEGFDVALIEAAETLGPLATQVPAQYNLHVFDWVCACGVRQYQGPQPAACACGGAWRLERVWQKRPSRLTEAWAFDQHLRFEYWGGLKDRAPADVPFIETMSCLGACWFLSRARYHELGGLDEGHGGWGQMGTEIACKSWLSGGSLVTNRRTWFAHLFRTQQGFGFPYPLSEAEKDHARRHSVALWTSNAWPGQVQPLRDLVQRFWPVKGWTQTALDALPPQLPPAPTKGIVYYSDGHADPDLLDVCRRHLQTHGLPIVSVTLAPVALGQNLVLPLVRGALTMFRQILAGLEALDTDLAFLCEHDVLYASEHFAFTPPDAGTVYYNEHVWKVDAETGKTLHYRCNQTSGICANRQLLVDHYRRRVARVEAEGFSRSMGFEPGTRGVAQGGIDDLPHAVWHSVTPNVDIRHGANLTPSRWRKDQFRNQRYTAGWTEGEGVPGWGLTTGRFGAFLQGAVA